MLCKHSLFKYFQYKRPVTAVDVQLFCPDSVQITCTKSQLQSARTFLSKCSFEVIIISWRLRERANLVTQKKGKMEKKKKILILMQVSFLTCQALFSPIKNQMAVSSDGTHTFTIHLSHEYNMLTLNRADYLQMIHT